ncbi:MAG: hypothetical protein GY696_08945 [Gammaproteobacteria bacterium]|nr:hypothetical protein [Gammaproteobacteria bacterium]
MHQHHVQRLIQDLQRNPDVLNENNNNNTAVNPLPQDSNPPPASGTLQSAESPETTANSVIEDSVNSTSESDTSWTGMDTPAASPSSTGRATAGGRELDLNTVAGEELMTELTDRVMDGVWSDLDTGRPETT